MVHLCRGMAARATGEGRERLLRWVLLIVLLAVGLVPGAALAEERVHIVQSGETLSGIAARHGTTVQALVTENKLANPNLIMAGQRLRLPEPGAVTTADNNIVHVVERGEILSVIAARYGVTAISIALANDLRNPNVLWAGQKLRIPGTVAPVPEPTPEPLPAKPSAEGSDGKWIEVILSSQTVIAWEGQVAVRRMIVSTGLPGTPTVTGRFNVYAKYVSAPMSGPGYYLPAVPHTMYYYRGYALHGAYWHNNFGRPMSHGCVNLNLADAAWLFDWTPMGTLVVVHY